MANLTIEELAFLEHVYDQTGRDTWHNVDVPQNASNGSLDARPLAARLRQVGLLREASLAGDVYINQEGIEAVEDLRRRRADRPARASALRLALIQWLYGFYADGGVVSPSMTADFKDTDDAHYLGKPFLDAEIAQAVTYLTQKGLVDGARFDQTPHIIRPYLTDRGVDCAESGKSVSEFLNQPSSGPVFHVTIEGSQNVVVGTQSDFTQNNAGSSIDPEVIAKLIHFATAARQSLPGAGLDQQQQAAAEQAAQELEAEANQDAPDRGRLKKLAEALTAAVAPVATTALGGIITALGQQAVAAISS